MNQRTQVYFVVLGFLLLATIPLFIREYWLYVLAMGLYYATLASSWTLLAGYVGQISFAHAAFAAIGAYTTALLMIRADWPPALAIGCGALLAAVVGIGLGRLTLPLKGPYLALATIAFSEMFRIAVTAEADFTRGSYGLSVPALFPGTSRVPYYYTMLAVAGGTLVVLYALVRSHVGLYLRAIREDEAGAAARGVPVTRYKILAFSVSGFFAALAGGFYAPFVQLVSPHMAALPEMATILAMSVFGGLESLIAAALGAFVLQILLEWLRAYPEWRLVLFGATVLVTVRFFPNGLLVGLYNFGRRLFSSGRHVSRIEETPSDYTGEST